MTYEDLQSKEMEAVEVLRRRLKGQMNQRMYEDTNMFQRFLRARSYNINAAETMLKNHLQWRKANQIDSIIQNYVHNEVLKYFTVDILGVDKEGSPIFYWEIGNLDVKGLWKSVKRSEVIKYIFYLLEKNVKAMEEQSAKLNRKVDTMVQILNFENLSMGTATHKPTLDLIAQLVSAYESNYPERMKAGIVVNASFVFSVAFSVIKPFLSGPTAKKIHIFSKDGYQEELLKTIDPDVLPAFLGGNRADPDGDPMCRTFIHHGGLVPEEYHIYKHFQSLAGCSGVKKLAVPRMSKTEVPVCVVDQGSCIDWEFQVKNGDIGFTVLYKERKDDTAAKELIPKQRIDTVISSETGLLRCEKPGIYIIEFDNAYSWMYRKDVYCKLGITDSTGEKKVIVT